MSSEAGGRKRLPILGKTHPAVIAVWAAIVAAGHILPSFPMFGTGSNFSITAALGPLSGVFFGPVAGALCSAVGGFIGNIIAPHTAWMGMGTFIIGTVTAFTTGCIAWGYWPIGIVVYVIGTILWFTKEIGRSLPLFPIVYYGLGFIALVVGGLFAKKMLTSRNVGLKFPAVWLSAFGGMIGGAAIGNFFSLILYSLPKEVWASLIVIAPLERAAFSAGAMVVGVPLLIGLPKIGIFVGPKGQEEEASDADLA
jgi:hypothetical protein